MYSLTISEREEQAQAWGELLSRYRWDAFVTLTYANPCRSTEKVTRDFRRLLYRWQRRMADASGRPLKWFKRRYVAGKIRTVFVLGIEKHRSGSYHAHAIVRFDPQLGEPYLKDGWDIWFNEMSQGMCRIERPKKQIGVAIYVAKYVAKEGEIVLSDSFHAPAGLPLSDPVSRVEETANGSRREDGRPTPGASILDAPGVSVLADGRSLNEHQLPPISQLIPWTASPFDYV